MAIRIKSRWQNAERQSSIKENAQALAFITWRIALERAINLHGEDYVYENDGQRLAVIAEFLAFLITAADRLAYGRMVDDERHEFINMLAQRLGDHLQENMLDLFGPGEYRAAFIDRLNERAEDYAEFTFEDDEPGYGFLRYLGEKIQKIMGEKELNRWVINQVIEIDGPHIFKLLKKSMFDLFG